MAQLSDKDLALLSSLIYCDEIVKQPDGTNLGALVKDLLARYPDSDANNIALWELGLSGDFGWTEKDVAKKEGEEAGKIAAGKLLRTVLEEVKASDALKKLTIAKSIPADINKPQGMPAACFLDADDNTATVAFRGTDTSYKAWGDNVAAAGLTDSQLQKLAKDFIDSLEYENITVTGHSKGGNLSAYVAIMCDNVGKAVSFDGQRFSAEFFFANLLKIAANKDKITTISAYKDKVNTLLFPIGKNYYIETKGTGVETAHLMYYLIFVIDDEGNIVRDKKGKAVTIFDEAEGENKGNYLSEVLTKQSWGTKIFGWVATEFAFVLPNSFLTDIVAPLVGYFSGKAHMTGWDKLHMVLTLIKGLTNPVNLITLDVIIAVAATIAAIAIALAVVVAAVAIAVAVVAVAVAVVVAVVAAVVAVAVAAVAAVVTLAVIVVVAAVQAVVTLVGDVIETLGIFFETVGIGIAHIGVGLWDILAGIFTLDFERVFNGLVKILYGAVLIIWGVVSGFLNLVIDALNFVINICVGIINGIGSVVSWIGGLFGQDWGWHFNVVSPIPKINPNIEMMFESGGFPVTGQPFIAREAGPELVGTLNGRNAVINNDQIVEAVAIGVFNAWKAAWNSPNQKSVTRVFLDGKCIAMAGAA